MKLTFPIVLLTVFRTAWKIKGFCQSVNPINTGLFCLVVALGEGGGGVFHPLL